MKKILTIIIIALLSFSCGDNKGSKNSEKLDVVVSILPYKNFVESITDDDFNITVMVPPGVSPETYEPTPQQLTALSNADIYIQVGGSLEFERNWIKKIKKTYPNIKFFNPGKYMELIDENPHIWLGHEDAKYIVYKMTDFFIQEFPENGKRYKDNLTEFTYQIDLLVTEYKAKYKGLLNNTILTFHPAWIYLTDRFNIKEISIEEEGKEPNAQSIAKIIDEAKAKNITTIFVEPQFKKSTAETIANEIGANLVEINPLPENYIENLKDVFEKIYLSLK